MMKLFLLSCCLIALTLISYSQDSLYLSSGELIVSKVLEITPAEIKYKSFDNQEGPSFVLLKSEVALLRLENGTRLSFQNESAAKVVPQTAAAPVQPAEDMFVKGRIDASRFYLHYQSAGMGGFISGFLFGPLIGLIPAAIISATPPKEHNLGYLSSNLMMNPDYRRGYTQFAAQRKTGRTWTNWAIGSLISVILFIVITN